MKPAVGRLPVPVRVGVLANATFTGLLTVALPLLLADRGESKAHIAVFFVLNALTAAALNLTVGRRLRRLAPHRVISGGAAVSAVGMLALSLVSWPGVIYPAGMLVMAMSLVYPRYVAMAHQNSGHSSARVMGSLRSLYVVGYVAGLGVFAGATELARAFGPALRPAQVAVALAVLNVVVAWLPAPRHEAGGMAAGTERAAPLRRPRTLLLTAAVAVLLLRAADSLRSVYLPLYAVATGTSEAGVSGLFAITSVVEFGVLVPLSAASDRFGSRRTLVVICLLGMLSFLLVVIGAGYPVLIGSQVVYAVFTAGFQSIGMVLLGEVLSTGMGGGAAVYTALVQVGSMVGILVPLAVPGYSPAVFLIAVAFCAVAALLLLESRRTTAVARATESGRGLG